MESGSALCSTTDARGYSKARKHHTNGDADQAEIDRGVFGKLLALGLNCANKMARMMPTASSRPDQ
jgi:hypothetical protein